MRQRPPRFAILMIAAAVLFDRGLYELTATGYASRATPTLADEPAASSQLS